MNNYYILSISHIGYISKQIDLSSLRNIEIFLNKNIIDSDQIVVTASGYKSYIKDKDKYKEDRKDDRTKIQASQQSELIDQRKNNKPPQSFESRMGFDNLGGFGLEQFEPR